VDDPQQQAGIASNRMILDSRTLNIFNCMSKQVFSMNAQGTSAGGTADLALFPHLPEEIRLVIWKAALLAPRLVELEFCHGDPDPGGYIMQGHFTSSCSIPVMLSVCQASRAEAQKEYELSFPTIGSIPKVYFNPSIDTLVLSWLGGLANTAFPIVRYEVFNKVEHICFTSWKLQYALRHLENNAIDPFPALKTIICALDVDSPDGGLGLLSIEEAQLTVDEQNLCVVKIDNFISNFVQRHPNRTVPTVMVRLIKRSQ
jgi:hypothetical protein